VEKRYIDKVPLDALQEQYGMKRDSMLADTKKGRDTLWPHLGIEGRKLLSWRLRTPGGSTGVEGREELLTRDVRGLW